jgi:hypothetical protein
MPVATQLTSVFRPPQHVTNDQGEALLKTILAPLGLTATKIGMGEDYGRDYEIEIFRNGKSTGMLFNLQLKSSVSPSYSKDKKFVSVKLNTGNARYLAYELQAPTFVMWPMSCITGSSGPHPRPESAGVTRGRVTSFPKQCGDADAPLRGKLEWWLFRLEDVKKLILETWSNFGLEKIARGCLISDRWGFGIHFGSDEISAKSIFSHLPVPSMPYQCPI